MEMDSIRSTSFGNRFILAAAEGSNQFWRYLVTLVTVLGFALVGAMPLMVIIASKHIARVEDLTFDRLGVSSTMWLTLNLIPFVAGTIGLLLCLQHIHGRRIVTLITPRPRVDWKKLLFAAGLWTVLLALLELVNYLGAPSNYTISFDPSAFLPLLLVSLLLLPIQTSMEELLFRGYLMQGIGLLTRRGWVALVVTSVLFGAMHMSNPEVRAYGVGQMLPFYIGMGALLGLAVLFDEGLEIALGLHAANNIYTAVLVNYSNSAIPTSSLFTASNIDTTAGLLTWYLAAGLFLVIVARKYRWTNSLEKFGRIEIYQEIQILDLDESDVGAGEAHVRDVPEPVPPDDREP